MQGTQAGAPPITTDNLDARRINLNTFKTRTIDQIPQGRGPEGRLQP